MKTSTRRTLAALLAAFLNPSTAAFAQGGPPLVTDDPDTPGDGHWEINVAAMYARTHGRRELALPDVDMNYGWGDHVQLKLDIPWMFSRDGAEPWKSALGAADVGVKWRFVDAETAGYALSTYPQLTWNMLPSSARRGISSDAKQFLLPVEASTEVNGWGLDAEVGRNFVEGAPGQWVAGAIAARQCAHGVECLLEVHETRSSAAHETLVNLGFHWKLNESLTLLGAVGHGFGSHTDDQHSVLAYLGVQILR